MTVSEPKFQWMVETTISELVWMLVDKENMCIYEALDFVYNSETYQILKDSRSGFYFQSPGYVFSYLLTELKTGKAG